MRHKTSVVAIAASADSPPAAAAAAAEAGAARSRRRRPAAVGGHAGLPDAGAGRADRRRRPADHRPGRRRGAGAGPAVRLRRHRPGRQRARRLRDERREPDLAHAAGAERPERPTCRTSTCRPRPRFAGGISKALTSSYFSSVGAAFSSRTANDILQETLPAVGRHARPGERPAVQRPVQPAALLRRRRRASRTAPAPIAARSASAPTRAPSRSTGTAPWSARSRWSATASTASTPNIATMTATSKRSSRSPRPRGFEPPPEIRADRITIDGSLLRYSDATPADFRSNPRHRAGLRRDQRRRRHSRRSPRLL